MPESFDVVVAGSGFAGSIAALILNNLGFKVCLVEKGKHPRFAIGESSTPIADLLLREIASKYSLPWLSDFSRYGSWQNTHPEVVCGLKRGFSFFKHSPGQTFTTDSNHKNELLVAASADDIQSDTNWLRADFDAFVSGKAVEAGIVYHDQATITAAQRDGDWTLNISQAGCDFIIKAGFIIDATGSGTMAESLFGVKSSVDSFLTHSIAIFSHFDDVPRWSSWLEANGTNGTDYPFDPDHSALHQVLDEGWMWMLRFNDRRTSLGFVLNVSQETYSGMSADDVWYATLTRYPSLANHLSNLSLSAQPGKIIKSERLQRRLERGFGTGWVALPHSIGFVDPLFSPGIAHTLSGVEKVVNTIKESWGNLEAIDQGLKAYEKAVFSEIRLIDQLIAGCYQTMPCFDVFNIWSMLYFAATIQHEQQLINKQPAGYFLGADNEEIIAMVQTSYAELPELIKDPSHSNMSRFAARIKERIRPFNTARLLDPSLKNMYTHTAARI